jgi:hypothetical protein
LKAIYPEHSDVWKKGPATQYKPRGFWKDKENQRVFFDQLGVKLNIQQPEEWLKVTRERVLKEGGKFVDTYFRSSVVQGKPEISTLILYRRFCRNIVAGDL